MLVSIKSSNIIYVVEYIVILSMVAGIANKEGGHLKTIELNYYNFITV